MVSFLNSASELGTQPASQQVCEVDRCEDTSFENELALKTSSAGVTSDDGMMKACRTDICVEAELEAGQ
jgi:hypothetical protein